MTVNKTSAFLTREIRVCGYVRVSSQEQADSGAGLEAQRRAISDECKRRGWTLTEVFEDAAASAKSLSRRPGLQSALDAVESGRASAIVVMKLDRLSRSVLDFANLLDRSRRRGWAVAALDLALDTTSPAGEAMASVIATFAQYERRLIGQRTREALAVKRAQGVRIGRPRSVTDLVARRVRGLRARGLSLRSIAARLDAEGCPTGHRAASWSAESVRWLLTRELDRSAARN